MQEVRCPAAACIAALSLSLHLAPHAHAIEAAFGHCRDVVEAGARLACYDAIPFTGPRARTAASGASAASAPPSAAAPVAARAAAVTSPLPSAIDRFGWVGAPAQEELQSISSSVNADFFGWGPRERIPLVNGQVWEVIDGSSGTVAPANRKVTVRRGALGSFFLDFEGLNISPRVRRLR